jgi:hypothetical protein
MAELYEITEQQFSREETIHFRISQNFFVLGCGGIGSHVVDLLASFKEINNIIVFDPDKIEISNILRSTFKYNQLGEYKVISSAIMAQEKNLTVSILPVTEKFSALELKKVQNYFNNVNRKSFGNYSVIDCRDDYYGDYDIFDEVLNYSPTKLIRCAYNGISVTIDKSPRNKPVFGNAGYSQIPSCSIPSRLSALLGVMACINHEYPKNMPETITSDIYTMFNILFKGLC